MKVGGETRLIFLMARSGVDSSRGVDRRAGKLAYRARPVTHAQIPGPYYFAT